MADKHILRIHDTQANLIAELKDKQIAWATDINEAIWRNGTNFHFLSSGKYWDGSQFVFDNIDAGKVSLFDRTAGTILGELDADAGTFTINFAGSPINIDASSLDLTGVSVTADDPTLAQEVATKNYVDNATPATPSLQDVTDQGSTTTNSITAAGVISSTDLFQSSSANVSLANNTLGGVTFYGATSELNSTGGVLRLGNTSLPIEQQFLKATDKGAVYTGLKMLAKDTTTNEVFMADVPSGSAQDLETTLTNGSTTGDNKVTFETHTNSSPANGDIWFDGTNVNVREGGSSLNIASTNTAQTITGQKTHTSQLTIQNVAQTNVLRLPSVTHSPSTGDIYRNGANNNVQGNWVVSNNITASGNVSGKITKHTSTTNSSPANGDIWFDGTNLKGREGGATFNLNGGGGGATKIKYQATTNIANITGGTALSGSYFATKIIPEADIDADKFEYYVTSVSAGKTVYCGVYDSAGTTLLGEASGNTDTLGEHETASISGGPVSLTGGQVYWLAILEGSGSPNLGSKTAYSDSNLNRSAFISATPTGMPSSIGGGFSTTTGFFIGVKA